MYLQADATRVARCACAKVQSTRNTKHTRTIFLSSAMLLASLLAAAPFSAQSLEQTSVAPQASINTTGINQFGSPALREVNFAGSASQQAVNQLESSSALPEAPSAALQEQSLRASTPEATQRRVAETSQVAPLMMKTIPAGWTAQPLTARNKMEMGARNLYSPFSLLGYLATTGYEQAENGQPNFGTNAGAFGKRLRATVMRDSTENAFSDIVFAPLLHEDPRYYVQGPQRSFIHRVLYAATRPIITRTDSGRTTLNGAELLGYASASALSYTYYPAINQNFHDTAATFGGSLAGSALGNLVLEFSGQLLEAMHMKKHE